MSAIGDRTREVPEKRPRLSFMDGARDIMPIMVSTVPFGIVYGALAAQKGLSLTENVAMSALTFAGASQFVALEFWRHPLPFWTIVAAVFAVNLRHVLYSAAIGRRMAWWPAPTRYLGLAFLTDPTFALAELNAKDRLTPAYYFGLSIPIYANWSVTTLIGAVFGNMIGKPETLGLDFIVTAYFLYLVVSFRKRRNAMPVIVASAVFSLGVYLTAGSPWHIGAGAVAGMAIAGFLASHRGAAA
jgi:4-azaleucine resistance transporter AzlC